MLLTKDNLLTFVKTQKFVTPTQTSKEFEVTTTIASAALSELVKDNLIFLTHLKFGTTPYYYDYNQKECLIEIVQKHFSGNELKLFEKIQSQQIISKNALSIPEKVIISKLKDIFYTIELEHESKQYEFYVWYMRDKHETQQQIKQALGIENTKKTQHREHKENKQGKEIKETKTSQHKSQPSSNPFEKLYNITSSNTQQEEKNLSNQKISSNTLQKHIENAVENPSNADEYLLKNNFEILEKEKKSFGNIYFTSLNVNGFSMKIDCIHITQKKITLKEILDFYTSSLRPKYILHTQLPKKIETTLKELDNCFIIELKH